MGRGTSHKCRPSPEGIRQRCNMRTFVLLIKPRAPERVLRFYSRCNSAIYTFIVQILDGGEVDVMHILKKYYIHTLYPCVCIVHNPLPLHDMILLELHYFSSASLTYYTAVEWDVTSMYVRIVCVIFERECGISYKSKFVTIPTLVYRLFCEFFICV